MDVHEFLTHLDGVKSSGDQWTALCPAHRDSHPSLSVRGGDDGRVLLNCFAGCSASEVVEALGLEMRDLFPDSDDQDRDPRDDAEYEYRDDAGHLLYKVVRRAGKRFSQCRPARPDDDPGTVRNGFVWSMKYADGSRVPRVLYRLPAVLKNIVGGIDILVVEGEKDTETLCERQYIATCNSGGAGKWRGKDAEGYAKSLEGANVLVIPDNDDPGRAHAADIVWSIEGRARAVHVLDLPPEVGGKPVKDVTDFFDHGGTEDDFEAAWDAAPSAAEWMDRHGFLVAEKPECVAKGNGTKVSASANPSSVPQDPRPRLQADDHDLERITGRTWEVIKAANGSTPKLFRHGGVLSRVEMGDDGRPFLKVLGLDHVRGYLASIASWGRVNPKTELWEDAYPPVPVVRNLLTTAEPPLPVLERVVESPVFTADGTLVATPGFDAKGRVMYAPAPDFKMTDVPVNPSPADVAEAARILQEELLGDFPFVGAPDRAHVIAGMLLPFVRALVDGATPLHLVEKPSPGTGATKLVNVISLPFLGRPVSTLTEGNDEDEWRKRVTALLVGAPSVILIDNLRRKLDSAALSAALTSPTWEDRLVEHDDVVQIGAIGLVKAWPKFDPNRNCSIETFVSYAVRGSIFRQLQEMWAQANHEAPPPDDEPVGPWPLPERAVLCREVVDFVSDLGVAEQSLIYGRIDDETYAALAAQLGLTLSAAVRWHARALKRVRRAAGVTYAPESATTCSVTT